MHRINFLLFLSVFIIAACSDYKKIESGPLYKTSLENVSFYSVPENYNPHNSYPLIIVLHGLGGNAEAFAEVWKPVTDSLGVILLSVQGETAISDAGNFSWGKNYESNILSSIDMLKTEVNIDEKNIFIAGFSAGGSIASYLGLKYPMQIKGFAALSAGVRKNFYKNSFLTKKNRIYIGYGSEEKEFIKINNEAEKYFNSVNIKVFQKVYEGIGHNIPEPRNKTISEIINFLIH